METITLTKPDGTKFQVNDRRGEKLQRNFQTFKSGYVINDEPEPLMPTSYSDFAGSPPKSVAEVEQEQRDQNRPDVVRSKRPVANDDEALYPLGVEIEDED